MHRLIFLVAIFASCAASAQHPRLVRELPGNIHHGQRLCAFGYLNVEFENVQLGYSDLDVGGGLRYGPWVDGTWDRKIKPGWTLLEGTVDLNDTGHMGGFPFTLKNVRIIRRYPDYIPVHPELDRILHLLYKDDAFDPGTLKELRSITGCDAGPDRLDWQSWLWNKYNPWRDERIDRAVTLPKDSTDSGE